MASRSGIWAWARRRLKKDASELPDLDVDAEAELVVIELLQRYPALVSYDAIVGADKKFFDKGAGIMAAIALRSSVGPGIPTGEIESIKTANNEYKFSNGKGRAKSVEQQWLDEANQALGQVTAIRAYVLSRAANSLPFVLSGPSRTAENNGRETLLSSILRPLSDSGADSIEREL